MLYQWLFWGRLGSLLVKGPLTNPHVPHRSQICPTRVPHRYHMDPIWVPHRHPAATQIPCRSHTGPTHTQVSKGLHGASWIPHRPHTGPTPCPAGRPEQHRPVPSRPIPVMAPAPAPAPSPPRAAPRGAEGAQIPAGGRCSLLFLPPPRPPYPPPPPPHTHRRRHGRPAAAR